MPQFERGDVSIYYETSGEGAPLVLLAPGGLDSVIGWWPRAAIDPLAAFSSRFHLIAMDQRNAGRSRGPLDADDPWGSYVEDQLALADHLGLGRFHVMGCCIGCSYALKMIERAPDRVVAAVLEQPIGIVPDNKEYWATRWKEWSGALLGERPDLDRETADRWGAAMWGGDFVGSVTRDFVATVTTPLLVLPGVDQIHPREIGLEVAELAPGVELVDPWRDDDATIARATELVGSFIDRTAPV